jgi:adenylylsulfate kinase
MNREKSMEPKSQNIYWNVSDVQRGDRERSHGHRGVTVWLTGLSGSGKSTLARLLEAALFERKCHAFVLDGDNIRHGLNRDLGFSPEDRAENIRRIGEVSKLFTDFGAIVVTAFISPYRADRDLVRGLMAEGDFIEAWVDCALDVCEQRDPKGLYKKARRGEVKEFTGISAPYESPASPELVLRTDRYTPEECIAQLLGYLEANGYLAVTAGVGAGT